jgi:hypothetical protein
VLAWVWRCRRFLQLVPVFNDSTIFKPENIEANLGNCCSTVPKPARPSPTARLR